MSVTPHTTDVDEIFTLTIGDQSWAALLAVAYPGMSLGHRAFHWEVVTGGPVAVAKKTMAAITDGTPKGVGEPDWEGPYERGSVNGAAIHFYATANGDQIRVKASNR